MLRSSVTLLLLWSSGFVLSCDEHQPERSSISPEKRVLRSNIAIKALVTNTYPRHEGKGVIAELWILDVYKGAEKLAVNIGLPPNSVNIRDQRVNVSHWGDKSRCWNTVLPQKTYIILLTPSRGRSEFEDVRLQARYDDRFAAAIEFSQETEKKVLKALGWNPWSDWNPCSKWCGGGFQERQRSCHLKDCEGYNAEKRSCNSFKCEGSTNTLSVREDRYFKPSRSVFQRVKGREGAWLIRPGSYFLLPFKQAFGKDFPKDFTIFLTIKPAEESEGIIFSLNARNSRQEYISLELTDGRLELVHSLANGTKIIDIPAQIGDGNWHQLAISVDSGSSIRTYLDCHWVSTQILHKHSLNVPKNADLIIGYMFQGEIEQLSVSGQSGAVSQQCSVSRTPLRREAPVQSTSSDITIFEEDEQENIEKESVSESRLVSAASSSQYRVDNHAGLAVDGLFFGADYTGSGRGIFVSECIGEDFPWIQIEMDSVHAVTSVEIFIRQPKWKRFNQTEVTIGSVPWSRRNRPVQGNVLCGSVKSSPGRGTVSVVVKCSRPINGKFVVIQKMVKRGFESCLEIDEIKVNVIGSSKPWRRHHDDYIDEEYVDLDWSEEEKATPSDVVAKKQPERKRTVNEGSGNDRVDDEEEEEKKKEVEGSGGQEEEEGSGMFELEWSTWSACSVSCGRGRQFRSSRCIDNGFLEECIAAGMERTEFRECSNAPCQEVITVGDVEKAKRKMEQHHIPTNVPKEELEEHTNAIPHVPNYWVPHNIKTQTVTEVTDHRKCACANGGTCYGAEAKCKCKKGFTGIHCERALCRPECQNGGKCVQPDVCACPEGFTGARCQKAFCHPACQNGGRCVAPFKCSCPIGTSGTFCENFSCQPMCANGGLCIGRNLCSCPHGFSGRDCRERTCTIRCENGGICTMPGNKCKCPEGFYGARCHKRYVRLCEHYVPVRVPRRRAFQQVVEVPYETVCEGGRKCTKNRSEYKTSFQTTYHTVYKCAEENVAK